MADQGKLIVVSGFSGSGKGTVIKDILDRYGSYSLSISATTRKPREGEVDGREYFFKTIEEFEKMVSEDMLIEYAKYVGNYYGTPRDYVEKQLSEGRDVILEIEIQGAMKVKERYPEAILIFLTPPSGKELIGRLKGRGTEDDSVITSRMKRALEEAEGVGGYDYVLVNDEIDKCSECLHYIVQRCKDVDNGKDTPFVSKRAYEVASDNGAGVGLINGIKAELAGLLEGDER
ncbi:MAG: guanylate kinase [Lachnospiraceae bacterium]|nr:guanylate kinase [Lachnospiraceae bacterium]